MGARTNRSGGAVSIGSGGQMIPVESIDRERSRLADRLEAPMVQRASETTDGATLKASIKKGFENRFRFLEEKARREEERQLRLDARAVDRSGPEFRR